MSGSDVIRSILSAFDLGELSNQVYSTYLTTGVTDPDYLLLTVENTPDFQARFPGIRDASGRLIMQPAQYVTWERSVQAQMAQYGHPPLTRAELGAVVQSGRSADEVAQDLAAFDELRNNPYVRRQFYAYTGIDPGDEGLFALALGLPSADSLQRTYAEALDAGIPQPIYEQRLGNIPTPATAVTAPVAQAFAGPQTGGTITTTPEPVTGEIQPPAINIYQQGIARMDRLRALRQAELANQAQFKSGGAVTSQPGGPQQPRPYSF